MLLPSRIRLETATVTPQFKQQGEVAATILLSTFGALLESHHRPRPALLLANRIFGLRTGRARPPGAPIKERRSPVRRQAWATWKAPLLATPRSCEPRLPRGDWRFVLQLSRPATLGISLRRNRAFRFAQG